MNYYSLIFGKLPSYILNATCKMCVYSCDTLAVLVRINCIPISEFGLS